MTNEAKCFCSADFCRHNGEQCGKPVKFTVKTQALVNNDQYGPPREVGICGECWINIETRLSFLFGPGR
jgi:hypothetical protein